MRRCFLAHRRELAGGTLEVFRPELLACLHVRELQCNLQLVSLAFDVAVQDELHAQLASCSLCIVGHRTQARGRAVRNDGEFREARQPVAQQIRDAAGEQGGFVIARGLQRQDDQCARSSFCRAGHGGGRRHGRDSVRGWHGLTPDQKADDCYCQQPAQYIEV